jgi:hypothetical protein
MKVEEPQKLTEDVRTKLEAAAAIGCNFEECAFYANISKSSLYNWFESVPGLRERLDALHDKPVIKARQTVVSSLDDVSQAKWYLGKKRPAEFGEGADGASATAKVNPDGSVDLTMRLKKYADEPEADKLS